MMCERLRRLTTETVKGTALALQSIDDIEGCDCELLA
jgi:hypothetical protein